MISRRLADKHNELQELQHAMHNNDDDDVKDMLPHL
jgi:hypothetical protein